jgi:hypothetical protein
MAYKPAGEVYVIALSDRNVYSYGGGTWRDEAELAWRRFPACLSADAGSGREVAAIGGLFYERAVGHAETTGGPAGTNCSVAGSCPAGADWVCDALRVCQMLAR